MVLLLFIFPLLLPPAAIGAYLFRRPASSPLLHFVALMTLKPLFATPLWLFVIQLSVTPDLPHLTSNVVPDCLDVSRRSERAAGRHYHNAPHFGYGALGQHRVEPTVGSTRGKWPTVAVKYEHAHGVCHCGVVSQQKAGLSQDQPRWDRNLKELPFTDNLRLTPAV
jgi:hypothetical protein